MREKENEKENAFKRCVCNSLKHEHDCLQHATLFLFTSCVLRSRTSKSMRRFVRPSVRPSFQSTIHRLSASIRPSICPHEFVRPSVHIFIRPSVLHLWWSLSECSVRHHNSNCVTIRLSVCVSVYLSLRLTVWICLSVCLCVCLSVYLPVSLCVRLSSIDLRLCLCLCL